MWKRILLCAVMVLAAAGTAWAQDDLKDDPGYLDLDMIEEWFDKEPSIIVNVKGALLDLVAEASRYEDPDLADLLRKLKSVQVRGYDMSWTDFDEVQGRIKVLARRLEAQGWDTIIRVREDDEDINIHVRVDDGAIAGMVVMVVAPGDDETVFVNIVGEIDPEQIGRLGRKFDIEPLDGMTVDY